MKTTLKGINRISEAEKQISELAENSVPPNQLYNKC